MNGIGHANLPHGGGVPTPPPRSNGHPSPTPQLQPPPPNNILDNCVKEGAQAAAVLSPPSPSQGVTTTSNGHNHTHHPHHHYGHTQHHHHHTLQPANDPSPSRANLLIHSRSSSLTNNGGGSSGALSHLDLISSADPASSKNNTLTRKTTTTTVTTSERKTTNLVRELMGPDGQQMEYTARPSNNPPVTEYVPNNACPPPSAHFPPDNNGPQYDPTLVQDPYGYTRGALPPDPAGRRYNNHHHLGYSDYEQYPEYGSFTGVGGSGGYRPSTPSEASDSPSLTRNNNSDYLRGGGYPPGAYDDMDSGVVPRPEYLSPSANAHPGNYGVRWRDPDLHEVIQFLGNQNPVVKANAAAYLQHLCYMDDPVKAKTRALGGIPPLVALLSHDQPEVHRNACGALRNLSYGRQNDENKKAIKSAGGIPGLVRLLKRTPDNEVKELVTGVLWNLSSCEELKRAIIDDGILTLVNNIIIPHSGWDRNSGPNNQHIPDACWSTVFKNSSGVVRNVSSAGEYARKKLRECDGLVEALLHVVRAALSRADIDDKSVENCVCILRNLSYRCQEVEDPNYDKHPPPYDKQSRANATPAKGENLGCFGANKKKKEAALVSSSSPKDSSNSVNAQGGGGGGGGPTRSSSQQRTEPIRGMELLWQPEVVQSYLALLSNCSNPETLEAAAGAIQNLAACYWQPSIEIRAAVRKEKGLPVLVELLRMEVDRVVCAVATALRNLALDQRNKELIGKYAMRDLVQKLPSGRPHDQNTSDDTIAAVLATLNEVIKKNAEFSRSLMEAEGVERLVLLTQQKRRFSPRAVKFASQVLYSMWQHQELREVYKKGGWTESDFVAKGAGARGGSPGPSGNEASSAGSPVNANSTLNRPMASQSGTRYEDKTMTRGGSGQNNVPKSPPPNYPQGHEVPLADMPYPDGGSHAPPSHGVFRMYPPHPVKPGEPLYAQVNREKKKNRGMYEGNNSRGGGGGLGYVGGGGGGGGYWSEHDGPLMTTPPTHSAQQPGGDSWV
ncbi:catenin delta-2 isoform X2 [Folsomia candida]|uniref:catenin delta-2 isoform X2 n=1 Tax=Folsomia candida TaxID=158441 RepID=UPI000B9013DE|nr:catenin delta-2 isoform X2 [Folsomia candida]